MAGGPPYLGIDWDDELEKAPEAIAALAEAHAMVDVSLQELASRRAFSLKMLLDIHRALFERLFPDSAGCLRGPPPLLPVNVDFGGIRGVAYDDVPRQCQALCADVARLLAELDGLHGRLAQQQFDLEALKLASYLHCELIRIHPFRNGNGRTARMCMNYVAYRYGLRPIAFDRPQGQYLAAIRTWLSRRRIDHFVNFMRPQWIRRSS